MSRFGKEVGLIPAVGWLAAALVYVGLIAVLVAVPYQTDPKMMAWPMWCKTLFAALIPVPVTIYVLLAAYIYGDARRRGMRHVLWTLLAIFIPNGIGIILYFVLRDPLLVHCTKCGAATRPSFAFCPHCGAALTPACPRCSRSVEAGWSNCPYCGAKL